MPPFPHCTACGGSGQSNETCETCSGTGQIWKKADSGSLLHRMRIPGSYESCETCIGSGWACNQCERQRNVCCPDCGKPKVEVYYTERIRDLYSIRDYHRCRGCDAKKAAAQNAAWAREYQRRAEAALELRLQKRLMIRGVVGILVGLAVFALVLAVLPEDFHQLALPGGAASAIAILFILWRLSRRRA